MCVGPHLLILFLIHIAWQMAQASAIRHCTRRRSSPASTHAPCPLCTPSALPTARSTDCDANVLRDDFDIKAWSVAWECDLWSGAGINLYSDSCTRKMYASLVQHQGREVRSFLNLTYPLLIPHSRPPFLPLDNPTPERAFLAKSYDENAQRAYRDTRGIFRTPQTHPQRLPRASWAHYTRRYSLASNGQACVNRDGGQWRTWETRGRPTDVDCRLYSGARLVGRSIGCYKTSLRAC